MTSGQAAGSKPGSTELLLFRSVGLVRRFFHNLSEPGRLIPLLLVDNVIDQIHRQREDDGGVFVGSDYGERFEIA